MQHKLASVKYFIAHANGLLFNCASCSKLNASGFICVPCIYHHHAFFVFICFCANIPRERKTKLSEKKQIVVLFCVHYIFEFIFWLPYIVDRTNWRGIKVGLGRHKQQTKFNNNTAVTQYILLTNSECNVQFTFNCSFSAVPVYELGTYTNSFRYFVGCARYSTKFHFQFI